MQDETKALWPISSIISECKSQARQSLDAGFTRFMEAAARTIEEQAKEIEMLRAQLTDTKDDYHRRNKDATERYLRLAEAVEILRAIVWTEPTTHYQHHWFPRGRAFCESYDAKLGTSAMDDLIAGDATMIDKP